MRDPAGVECSDLFSTLRNPYFLADDPGLTQTLGWVDSWTSKASAYAVLAENELDVAAAVAFARELRVRPVIKGTGHSYHGKSNAADSLLIWTRKLTGITLHGAFVGSG